MAILAVGNVETSLRSWHVHVVWETASVLFIYRNLFESASRLIEFDSTLIAPVHWHSLIIVALHIAGIVLWRHHAITVLRLRSSMYLAAHFWLWNLDRSEMTSFELRNFFVNWFLRWLVLLEVPRSRSLSVAIDEFMEINHTSIVATKLKD